MDGKKWSPSTSDYRKTSIISTTIIKTINNTEGVITKVDRKSGGEEDRWYRETKNNGSLHLRWVFWWTTVVQYKMNASVQIFTWMQNCLSISLIPGHYSEIYYAADSKSGAHQSNWLSIKRRTVWLQLKMSLATVNIYAHILTDSGLDSSKRVKRHTPTHTHIAHKCVNGQRHKMLMIEFNRLRIPLFRIIFLSVSYIK